MAESPDLEKKVGALESRVKKLEFSALAMLIIVFLFYILARH